MAADLRRALALLHSPENEWNRIVADPTASRTLRPTVGALLGAATIASTVGTFVLSPAGTSVGWVGASAACFVAGRLLGLFAATRFLRSRAEPRSATLLAGWGSVPILLAGLFEILPVPFLRWLWTVAGLGFAQLTLATAMTPVLGASSDRARPLSLRAVAAFAIPIVAFDLLRTVLP